MQTLGRYQILDELGRGGMGVVYRAFDPALGRQIAIKAIQSHEDPEFARRFLTEARAAALLQHPAIVTIYDAGQQENTLYIAMELIEGRDLAAVLASGTHLSLE